MLDSSFELASLSILDAPSRIAESQLRRIA
jgi:hypothetical protein